MKGGNFSTKIFGIDALTSNHLMSLSSRNADNMSLIDSVLLCRSKVYLSLIFD